MMRCGRIGILASVVFVSTLLCAGQKMSHEEQVVRTTYARLSYAMQVNEVVKAVDDSTKGQVVDRATLHQRLKSAEMTFVLSDFKIGSVTDDDIAQTKYSDLVTKPSGDSLDITPGYSTFGTDSPANGSAIPQKTQSMIAFAQWHKSQTVNEDWEQPWAKMFPMIERSDWFSRYAAFKVSVNFQGRFREYHALFLFGHDPKTGAEYVVPVDTVAGLTGALHFFIRNNAYPETLIEGGLGREIPAVHGWLEEQATEGKTHDDNCDPTTANCGVSRQDLDKLEKLPHHISLRKGGSIPITKEPLFLAASLPLPFHPMMKPSAPTSCSGFSTTFPHTGFIQEFSRHENPGPNSNHTLVDVAQTSCTYSDSAGTTCNTQCNVTVSNSSIGDVGPVTGFCHVVNKATKNDTQNGAGAGTECGGGVGGGVKECLGCACGVTVSISGSGASVSISSDGFYTANDGLGQKCAAQANPNPPPPPPPPQPTPTPNCDPETPQDLRSGTGSDNNPCASPIIIDTSGNGYRLTSAANGVLFDISGAGTPIRLGWTQPGSGNAFLVLPQADGTVINGQQLFGNFTPQPPSARPNGYAALAVYDQADHGGNGDGVIDQNDEIFSSLRLWLDDNHDGVCQPEELHTLPQLGVFSISLDYSFSERTDDFGNLFRYRARVNQGIQKDGDPVDRKAYDVFFVTQ